MGMWRLTNTVAVGFALGMSTAQPVAAQSMTREIQIQSSRSTVVILIPADQYNRVKIKKTIATYNAMSWDDYARVHLIGQMQYSSGPLLRRTEGLFVVNLRHRIDRSYYALYTCENQFSAERIVNIDPLETVSDMSLRKWPLDADCDG
jgi:hypothetical protein